MSKPLTIREFSLVLLIGLSEEMISNFAYKHFAADDILSLPSPLSFDQLDEQFQALSKRVTHRLAEAKNCVIHAPFLSEQHNKPFIELAQQAGARLYAFIFDLSKPLLREYSLTISEVSLGKQIKLFQRSIQDIASEGFIDIHVLDSLRAMETTQIQIIEYLDWDWSQAISRRYIDFSQAVEESFYVELGFYQEAILAEAELLVEAGKANDDDVRRALPTLLHGASPKTMAYVLKSAKNWLPDEQVHLRAYWVSLWYVILGKEAAFETWDWSLAAADFINAIDDPKPYLLIWDRRLQAGSRAALIHVINTIVDDHTWRDELEAWLIRPVMQQWLEKAFFENADTRLGQRLSLAEQRLKQLHEKHKSS